MAEPVTERGELADALVQLVGLDRQLATVDARLAVRREHVRDLVERETGVAPEGDQRKALQDRGVELTPLALAAGRFDQAPCFVVADRAGRDARGPAHFADVHLTP